jgi:hypothetical protein
MVECSRPKVVTLAREAAREGWLKVEMVELKNKNLNPVQTTINHETPHQEFIA